MQKLKAVALCLMSVCVLGMAAPLAFAEDASAEAAEAAADAAAEAAAADSAASDCVDDCATASAEASDAPTAASADSDTPVNGGGVRSP